MKVEHEISFDKVRQDITTHVKKHQVIYSLGAGIAVAGITSFIMRSVYSQPIGHGYAVTAKRGIAVLGKKVVMNNVSYFSADRQGPPSWVVRCKETGQIFTSQFSAATEMNITPSKLSKHLNGHLPHAHGFHFERICMAA